MSNDMQGKRVPDVTFRTREDHNWVERSTADVFAGKSVIVFSLPGAFTPTCSSSHVPRFNQLQPLFAERGIDEIICVSVNDAFVMNEWKHAQNADRVTFLPDGNGDFTTTDFVTALAGGGYEQGPRAAVAAVPEPSTAWLLVIGLLSCRLRHPRRR